MIIILQKCKKIFKFGPMKWSKMHSLMSVCGTCCCAGMCFTCSSFLGVEFARKVARLSSLLVISIENSNILFKTAVVNAIGGFCDIH